MAIAILLATVAARGSSFSLLHLQPGGKGTPTMMQAAVAMAMAMAMALDMAATQS